MVRISQGVHSDEDCRALQSLPDGYLVVEALGWWWAGRRCDVLACELDPLGPFPTAADAVEAAVMADQRTRTGGGRP